MPLLGHQALLGEIFGESPTFTVDLTFDAPGDALEGVEEPIFTVVASVDTAGDVQNYIEPEREFPTDFSFTVNDQLTGGGGAENPEFIIDVGVLTVNDTQAGEGLRESPPVLLTGADFTSTLIVWQVSVPAGASFDVEVSYDNGTTWYAQTNGAALSNLPGSPDGVTLRCRQRFTSNESGDYPVLSYLRIDVGEKLLLENGSVSYSYTPPRVDDQGTQAQIKRTGSITVTEPAPSYFDPGVSYLKPYIEMQAPSTGNWVRFYLGEFTTLAPRRVDLADRVQATYRMASRESKYASSTTPDYYVAPAERNIVLFVREDILVPVFGETEFDFPATIDVIPSDIVFSPGTSWLEVMNTALESAGWSQLTVNSDGQNTAQPAVSTKASEWTYPTQTPVLRASEIEPFTGDIPNVLVFRAQRGPSLPVEGNGIFTVKNFDTGPFSINSRGGLEVSEEVTVAAEDQEALARIGLAIAEVKFAGGGDRLNMTVAMNPLHDDQDSVTVTKSDLGLSSDRFWVTSWRADLGGIDRLATMGLVLEKMVTGVDSNNDPTAGASDAGVAGETCDATTALVAGGADKNLPATTDAAVAVSNASASVGTVPV